MKTDQTLCNKNGYVMSTEGLLLLHNFEKRLDSKKKIGFHHQKTMSFLLREVGFRTWPTDRDGKRPPHLTAGWCFPAMGAAPAGWLKFSMGKSPKKTG